MNTIGLILGESEVLSTVGEVFPVLVQNYDEFVDCSMVLQIKKEHFLEEAREHRLLDLLVYGMRETDVTRKLEKLFSLVLRKQTVFSLQKQSGSYEFATNEGRVVNADNYDELKAVIIRQNLIYEQKLFKSRLMQEWADKVLQARAKHQIKMEFEDMISTVSVFTGKHYWDLSRYTIYQLKSDFNRISKIMNYKTGVLAAINGSGQKIEHYSESLELDKNPYDELFVDSSKLNKLNHSMK